VLRLVDENDFPIWRALGTCLYGAATSALGEPSEGVARIEEGLEHYKGLRTPPVFWPLVRYLQAGAYLEARMPEKGLALMAEALELAGPDEVLAPLFHIVKGDLLLVGARPDVGAAYASYQHAFYVSELRQARMPQLRSAVRLFRVAETGERDKRAASVRAIHETFEEGLSTPDLVEAAAIVNRAH
jgi:hypothetical protein